MKSLRIDDIDRKILDFLQKDAKITAKQMADKLSLSQTPIYERVRKLENSGIIKSYVALIDPNLVNKSIVVLMNLTVKDHSRDARDLMVKQLKAMREISELFNTSGTYDFMAKGRFASIVEYRNFLVEKLTAVENVGDIDSHIVLEEIKNSTLIAID